MIDASLTCKLVGHYANRRVVANEAPREVGNIAHTDSTLTLCFTGEQWEVVGFDSVVRFEVLDRGHITGRGYYTVINNIDEIPVTIESVIVKESEQDYEYIPILGIEKTKYLLDPPQYEAKWALLTKEETEGDIIYIKIAGV